MTEAQRRQAVSDANMSLGNEEYLHYVDTQVNNKEENEENLEVHEEVVKEQIEEKSEKQVPDIPEKSSNVDYMKPPINEKNIHRVAKIISKSDKFVENRLINCPTENKRLDSILSMIETSCLAVHRYNIGDWVYIPEQTVDNTQGGFGVIQVSFERKPRRVQINKIIYTNKIQYSFVGFKKLVVLEEYCCSSESQCQVLCDRMNKK